MDVKPGNIYYSKSENSFRYIRIINKIDDDKVYGFFISEYKDQLGNFENNYEFFKKMFNQNLITNKDYRDAIWLIFSVENFI